MGAGVIYLIGGGPGAPDLISVRGARALERADVVIVDNLLPASFLDDLGISTAGKSVEHLAPHATRDRQDEITVAMIDAARAGRIVARLKGGDPLVFGRSEQELEMIAASGVAWEIVPGPTSGTACVTGAGYGLTWRGAARSVAFVTARTDGGGVADEFPRADSLVVFMGVKALAEIAVALVRQGWAAGTPALVIERGGRPWERRVSGRLDGIAGLAGAASVAPPALLVVGEAARARAAQRRPVVLYTGLDPTNFRALGDVTHWPALEIVPDEAGRAAVPGALEHLAAGAVEWAVFTSRVGVDSFFGAVEEHGLDARVLGDVQVVACGAGTDLRLRRRGVRADHAPEDAGGAGILAAMDGVRGAEVLLIQGTHAPRGLADALEKRDNLVRRLALHRVRAHPELGRPLPAHDVVYFASPSGAAAFREAYGEAGFGKEIWCMGAITRARIEEFGYQARIVSPHGSQG